MNEENWEVLEEVAGSLQAELLRGLLESQGIDIVISQEGLSHSVFSLTVGPLSKAQLLVPVSQLEQARLVLDRYYSGELELEGSEIDEEGGQEDQGESDL